MEAYSLVDISALSSGTYIVKVVTTNNDYEYLKLIKQ
ncbi:MAG: T9SS type A sorting domain-containing protein [Bacteroidales bacterium]|nr:T9SS type A sorting domain-containing protein [Bacteroidales bacterium]